MSNSQSVQAYNSRQPAPELQGKSALPCQSVLRNDKNKLQGALVSKSGLKSQSLTINHSQAYSLEHQSTLHRHHQQATEHNLKNKSKSPSNLSVERSPIDIRSNYRIYNGPEQNQGPYRNPTFERSIASNSNLQNQNQLKQSDNETASRLDMKYKSIHNDNHSITCDNQGKNSSIQQHDSINNDQFYQLRSSVKDLECENELEVGSHDLNRNEE